MEQPTPFLNRICLRTSSTQGRPTLNTSRLHKELVVLENCICVRSRRHRHTCGIGTLFFLYFSQEKNKGKQPYKELFGCFFFILFVFASGKSSTVLPSWNSSALPISSVLLESTFTWLRWSTSANSQS